VLLENALALVVVLAGPAHRRKKVLVAWIDGRNFSQITDRRSSGRIKVVGLGQELVPFSWVPDGLYALRFSNSVWSSTPLLRTMRPRCQPFLLSALK
jgi:hypothetical protein